MNTKVLIVDDEPLAQEILEAYINKIPGLEIAGKCKNALEAFSVLNKQEINLMLLDINMPEISGIEFLRTLKKPPMTIFTTAYSEFAVESYELDAVDYLVKPISFERFLKAINKATELLHAAKGGNAPAVTMSNTGESLLFVKSEGKLVKIDLSKLWFVEGLKDYVRFWTETGKVIVHATMKSIEEQLSGVNYFVRVSKSYIVNINCIKEIDGNTIRIKEQEVIIGSTYRDEINKLFNSYKLL